jgi:hypothetical protein
MARMVRTTALLSAQPNICCHCSINRTVWRGIMTVHGTSCLRGGLAFVFFVFINVPFVLLSIVIGGTSRQCPRAIRVPLCHQLETLFVQV